MRICGQRVGAGRMLLALILVCGGIQIPLMPVTAQMRTLPPLPEVERVSSRQLVNSVTQNQRPTLIDLDLKNVTLASAIQEIGKMADVRIGYAADAIAKVRRVSVHGSSMTVVEALTKALRGTSLIVANYGGQLAIIERGNTDSVPGVGMISGRVTDSTSGQGIPGVSVFVVGKKIGSVTDGKGDFTISRVPAGDQNVTFKILGYKLVTRSVSVESGSKVSMRVELRGAVNTLSGVVTTATGLQRKVEVGNDITTIKVEEVLRNNPVSNMSELLATRVPGLYAARTSGLPGAPTRIRIRGVSSINASNDPIIVVDGVQIRNNPGSVTQHTIDPKMEFSFSSLDQLDVNSIETVEVLKGPSAVALYGSDAANGVIVVTTKRGQPGQTRWTALERWGTESMPGKWPNNYYGIGVSKFFGGAPTSCQHDLWSDPFGCKPDSAIVYQILNSPKTTVFGTGVAQEHSVGVNGGARGMIYSLTASLSRTLGLMKLPDADVSLLNASGSAIPSWQRRPQADDKQSGSATVGIDPSPSTQVQFTTALTRSAVRSTPLSAAMGLVANLQPALPVYGPEGALVVPPSGLLVAIPSFRERRNLSEIGSRASLNVKSQALPNMNTSIAMGVDFRNTSSRVFLANGDCYGGQTACGDTGYVNRMEGSSLTSDVTVNLSGRPIGHRWLNFVPAIGGNFVRGRITEMTTAGRGLAKWARNGGTARRQDFNEKQESRSTVGVYMEARVNIANRFWLPFAIRSDAGSALGGAIRPKFPKIGFSYLMSDQPSFQKIPLIGSLPLLRMRASFGAAGRQPGLVDKYRTYSNGNGIGNTYFEGIYENGFFLNSIGNTALRPEQSNEWEYGFDSDMFEREHGRLSVSVTWARKNTSDLLISEKVAGSAGGFNQMTNLGDVRNSSFEFNLDGLATVGVLSWHPALGISTLRNQIVSLRSSRPATNTGETYPGLSVAHVIGYPLYGRWAKKLVAYSDLNSDGFIDVDEVTLSDSSVYIGAPYPKFTANTSQEFRIYNNVIFTSVLSYDHGITQVRSRGSYDRVNNDPSLSLREQAYGLYSVLTQVQQVSTLRWTSMQIGYIVPQHASSRVLGSRTVTLAVYGTNIGLWSTYRGKDPNVGALNDDIRDVGQLPIPRTWGVSLRIN